MSVQPRQALILAGSRDGDPMAAAAGVTHKALLPVHGVPMLHRVIATVATCPSIERITVAIDEAAASGVALAFASMHAAGRLELIGTKGSPSASVAHALAAPGRTFPLLVTTADHALLTPTMVQTFCNEVPDE